MLTLSIEKHIMFSTQNSFQGNMNQIFGFLKTIGSSLVVALFFVGCAENKRNFIQEKRTPPPAPVAKKELKGQLLDSFVWGVTYTTTSNKKGITDKNGFFEYLEGDEIEFTIGELRLGKVKAQSLITPLELAHQTNIDALSVVNRLRLLQSLDEDQNPVNGIKITEDARNKASALVFDQNEEVFTSHATTIVQKIYSARTLVGAAQAIEHFQNSLANNYSPNVNRFSIGTLKSPNPVIGMSYRLDSGFQAKTDGQGQFLYNQGVVSFSVGNIYLGEVTPKKDLTLLDLAQTTNLIAYPVINRQLLLTVLDNDSVVSNGIDVSQVNLNVSIDDYNIAPQTFINRSSFQEILTEQKKVLPPISQVITDLKTSFDQNQEEYKYDPLATIQSVLTFAQTGLVSSNHQMLANTINGSLYVLSESYDGRAFLKTCPPSFPCNERQIASTGSGFQIAMAQLDKLYFAMANTTNDLILVDCGFEASDSCSAPRKISDSSTAASIDIHLVNTHTAYVLATSTSGTGLVLNSCPTASNATPCKTTEIASSGKNPQSLLFNKTLFVTSEIDATNPTEKGKLFLSSCNLRNDPISCDGRILPNQKIEAGLQPTIALKNKIQGNKDYLFVAAIDKETGYQPMLTRCERLDTQIKFTSCRRFRLLDSSKVFPKMFFPQLLVKKNHELLILMQVKADQVTNLLLRCLFDENDEPTKCREFYVSQGVTDQTYRPRLTLQEESGFMYWLGRVKNLEYQSRLFKMNLEF